MQLGTKVNKSSISLFKLGLLIVTGTLILSPNLNAGGNKMQLAITSSAFSEGGMIPRQYSCDGPDISPDLSWQGVPEGSRSLTLICDDPDAPVGT